MGKKTAMYEMSYKEWSIVQASLERAYIIVPSGDRRLTISNKFNDRRRCGEVKFPEEPHGSVKVSVTSLNLERRIDPLLSWDGKSINHFLQNQLYQEPSDVRESYRLEN